MRSNSQCSKLAQALIEGRELTMLDCFMIAGSLNGHKRLSELRERGFNIVEGWTEVEYHGTTRKLRSWRLAA